jgi:hypothetical protein
VDDFERFEESNVWHDMMLELGFWLRDIHDALEDMNLDTPDKVLHRLGGNAEAIRLVKSLPETIRNNILAQREEEAIEKEMNGYAA